MRKLILAATFALTASSLPVLGQEPVFAAKDPEALFTSPDPQLNANKQVVYRIILELLEAGHWDKAGQYISHDYIQHNPNAKSGLAPVVEYFTQVLKVQPKPIPEKIGMKVADVVAEGDLVVVTYAREEKDPENPGRSYSTTWFDMWRIKDGKAVEHWDPALLNEAPDLR